MKTLASLQDKSKRLTLANLERSASAVDRASEELVGVWLDIAKTTQRWGADALARLLPVTQRLVVESAGNMATRGAKDGAAEVAGIIPEAAIPVPHVEVDGRAIGTIVMGLGDRLLVAKPDVDAGDHIRANANQAVRILDTESFAAYNRGRLAVETALLARGPGATFDFPQSRDAKDWVFGIVVRWDASLDRRTCPICRALDGTLRPLGLTFDGGPMPPSHPRCRCCGQFWPVAIPKRQ